MCLDIVASYFQRARGRAIICGSGVILLLRYTSPTSLVCHHYHVYGEELKHGGEATRVLVVLPGADGRHPLDIGKKNAYAFNNSQYGKQFYDNFHVVVPTMEGNWKSKPSVWIVDLVLDSRRPSTYATRLLHGMLLPDFYLL